jgi:hypothetical protein
MFRKELSADNPIVEAEQHISLLDGLPVEN